MENENALENAPENSGNFEERLQSLAEKSEMTVDEFICSLEEKQEVVMQNDSAKNRSTGSLGSESNLSIDPSGSEFLKGIWGK